MRVRERGGADQWPSAMRFVTGSAGVVTLITALALRYFYVIDRWQAQLAAHARAEADALQARIRPHFLFNSMNMIASLLRRDPEVAERAVLDLSDLFRAALGAGDGDSSLAEEVRLSEHYLGIEQLRLGERLRVDWQRIEPLPWDLPMPRLVLQPLLENAVLHGISRLPEGGAVQITLQVEDDRLRIKVRNTSLRPIAGRPACTRGHAQRSIATAWSRPRPRAACRAAWAGATMPAIWSCRWGAGSTSLRWYADDEPQASSACAPDGRASRLELCPRPRRPRRAAAAPPEPTWCFSHRHARDRRPRSAPPSAFEPGLRCFCTASTPTRVALTPPPSTPGQPVRAERCSRARRVLTFTAP